LWTRCHELVGENDSFHPERNPLDALLEYRPLEKVGFMLRLSRGERGHYIGLIDGKRKIAVYAFYRGDSPPWALGMDNDSLNASDSLEAGNRLAALKALHEIALLLEKPIGLALKHASEGAMARVCGLGSVTVERKGKVERVLLTPEEFFDIKADFCTHVGVVGKMNALRRVGYLLGEAYLKGYPGLNLDELLYDEKNGFVRDGAPWGERALVEDLAGELNPIRQSFLTFAQAIYIGEDEKHPQGKKELRKGRICRWGERLFPQTLMPKARSWLARDRCNYRQGRGRSSAWRMCPARCWKRSPYRAWGLPEARGWSRSIHTLTGMRAVSSSRARLRQE